jgi:hypothetical protein
MCSNQTKQLEHLNKLEAHSGKAVTPAVTITWEDFTQSTSFHGIRYIFTGGILTRR